MIENDGLISELSESVLALPADKPRIVAIDGFDGVGKTVFADQLANRLKSRGRQIIRASVDDFTILVPFVIELANLRLLASIGIHTIILHKEKHFLSPQGPAARDVARLQ